MVFWLIGAKVDFPISLHFAKHINFVLYQEHSPAQSLLMDSAKIIHVMRRAYNYNLKM
jgi:hypothetical protein